MKILYVAICLSGFVNYAQSQIIQGKVTEKATGNPLPGANITYSKGINGAISASDGS